MNRGVRGGEGRRKRERELVGDGEEGRRCLSRKSQGCVFESFL